MVNIYYFFVAVVILCCLFKPQYAIYLFTIFFFINPQQFFPDTESAHIVFISALILLFGTLSRGFNFIQGKFIGLLLLFILIVFISILFSGNTFAEGISLWLELIKVAAFVSVTICFLKTREEVLTYMRWIVLVSAANGIYATIEEMSFVLGLLKQTLGFRTTGFFQNANILAGILVGNIAFAYFFYTGTSNKKIKLIFSICIISMILGVLCSVSRTGLIALFFAGGCLVYKNIKHFTTFVLVGITIIFFSYFADALYEQRRTVTETVSGKVVYDHSTQVRLHLMSTALQIWLRYPVFGVGLTNFSKVATTEMGFRTKLVPHSAFLQILCETGLVGLVCFISILIYSLRMAGRLKSYGDVQYSELGGYCQIGLIAWIIILCFLSAAIVVPLWFTIALPFNLDTVYQLEKASLSNKPNK